MRHLIGPALVGSMLLLLLTACAIETKPSDPMMCEDLSLLLDAYEAGLPAGSEWRPTQAEIEELRRQREIACEGVAI